MKTSRATAPLIAAALCLAAAGTHAFELSGFRGVAWGDAAARLGTATVVSREGALTCYQRERENLMFGDAELAAVRYCFLNDRLHSVRLEAAVSAQAMAAELQRTYGRPAARRGAVSTWGRAPDRSRAELVAQGERSQLTISARPGEVVAVRTAAAAGGH